MGLPLMARFFFAPMLGSHVMTDSAAGYCTQDRMMPGNMTGQTTDHGALQATGRVSRDDKRLCRESRN